MKLGQKAIESLEKWGAFTDDRRDLMVESDRFSIFCEVAGADNLSCSLNHLRLEPRAALGLATEQLKTWGERLGKRVRYLLEAIEMVELDPAHGHLLLRSTPPEKKTDGSVFYYELLLKTSGSLRLDRYCFDAVARTRKSEPMHCTRELVEKLINDLAATAP